MAQRQSDCLHAAFPDFFSGRIEMFNFFLELEVGGMVKQNPKSLVSAPKYAGLDPKSLHNVFVEQYMYC